jgi:hypothetical protein
MLVPAKVVGGVSATTSSSSLPNIYDIRDFNGWNTTDAAATTNTAIQAVYAAGGGQLLIPSGTFEWGEKVHIDRSHIRLIGAGEGQINRVGPNGYGTGWGTTAPTTISWIGASGGTACEVSPFLSQFTASFSGTVMTVTAVTAGTISVGDIISRETYSSFYVVGSLGTGTGGTGTYILTSSAGTVASSQCSAENFYQNNKLQCCEVSGILFKGNNSGGYGLVVKSTSYSKFKNTFDHFTAVNMLLTCVPSTTCPFFPSDNYPVPGLRDYTDNQRNDIWYTGINVNNAGIGMQLTGLNNGNTSMNTIHNIYQVGGTGAAIRYDNTDLNQTVNLNCVGATYGLVLGGGSNALGYSRWNRFTGLFQPGLYGILVEGTNTSGVTYPSIGCSIDAYDDNNGSGPPVKGTGATLYWRYTRTPSTWHT